MLAKLMLPGPEKESVTSPAEVIFAPEAKLMVLVEPVVLKLMIFPEVIVASLEKLMVLI